MDLPEQHPRPPTPESASRWRDALRASFRARELPIRAAWMDPASAERAVDTALDDELARLDDHAFASSFAAAIGLATPTDYLPRVIDAGGTPLLCAVRFYGGDARRPFVELIAGDALDGRCAEAAARAMDAYAVFAPTMARVFVRGTAPPELPAGWRSVADQVLAVATAGTMGAPPTLPPVGLAPAERDEALAFVAAGYARLAGADPQTTSWLFPATSDDLEQCRADGRLWWWTIDDERAGLIAARRDSFLGLTGLLIVEELVAPAFAGRGSAASAQRELARRVAATSPGTLVLGTINARNLASRATARRAGRTEIASWHFLSPDA